MRSFYAIYEKKAQKQDFVWNSKL